MEATFTLLKIMRFEILKVLVPSIDRFLFYGTSGYLEYDNTQSLFECTYKYDKCKDLSYTKCRTKCFTKQTSLRIIERIHKKEVKKEKHDNTRPSLPRQTLSSFTAFPSGTGVVCQMKPVGQMVALWFQL